MRGTEVRLRTILVAILLAVSLPALADRAVLEGILARVNDRIITISDFKDRLAQELAQRPSPPTGEELASFARSLFESMVDEQVILERAQEKHVTVEDKEIDAAIAQLREKNNLQDDAAFKQALQESGLTEAELRERYRQNMLLQRTVQSEIQPTEITTEEIRKEYEKQKDEHFRVPEAVELEQIFFPVAEDDSNRDAVLSRARGLVSRARAGADLKAEATLAGLEVKSLGSIPVADLRPELAQAVAQLEPGGLTDPIATAGGYQVIRLVTRHPAGYKPLEEVKEQLRRYISQQRYHEQTQGLVEQLRKSYLVETHPELLPILTPPEGSADETAGSPPANG